MCTLCDRGRQKLPLTSRRNFLKGTAATGLAAGAMGLFGSRVEATGHNVNPPPHTGRPGRSYVIRNGYVMTMEPGTPGANSLFGEFIEGDVLVEGKIIKAISRNLRVGNATEIDARGKVVMPGFIDTHHHQAWTAIRSAIPDSILINDGTGTASAEQNIVAGKIRKWKGQLQDVDLDGLRSQLAATRDFLYSAAGVPQDPFPAK